MGHSTHQTEPQPMVSEQEDAWRIISEAWAQGYKGGHNSERGGDTRQNLVDRLGV